MSSRPDWTELSSDQKLALVEPLIASGKTGSQIAKLFRNCTRNAFFGFCSRRNLPVGSYKPKSVKKEPIDKKTTEIPNLKNRLVKPLPNTKKVNIPTLTFPEDTSHITSYENNISGCKWPLWDDWLGPKESMCCGSPKEPDQPYCEFHLKLNKGTGTQSEQSALRVLKKYG